MVPYYLSHFGFKDIFKSIFQNHSKKLIKEFYKEYSNKKHILLTPSCRIALYLSNIVINKTGLVLTSPLTCQSAIEPIIWAGKKPYFCDIDLNTLNIDPQKAIQILKSTTKISTLQVINHGGLSAYNKDLYQIAKEKGVTIIEDCAQSFGAKDQQTKKHAGYYSDIACFSLIKNAYGIGGGILATNDFNIYSEAEERLSKFPSFPHKKIIYRSLISILDNNSNFLYIYLNKKIREFRQKIKEENQTIIDFDIYRKTPHIFFFNVFKNQQSKFKALHQKRNLIGSQIIEILQKKDIILNYQNIDLSNSSFTKLFIYHPSIVSEKAIGILKSKGIDCKHLEQRSDSRVQICFNKSEIMKYSIGLDSCFNYFQVHDSLISLPLNEEMDIKNIVLITKELEYLIKEN